VFQIVFHLLFQLVFHLLFQRFVPPFVPRPYSAKPE
jgi:hypothetical protein